MHIILGITYNWKALEKDVKTFQHAQDLTIVHERCHENSKGLLKCHITMCFLMSLDYFMLTGFAPFFKNENDRARKGAEILQVHYEGISDVQLQPSPHVWGIVRLRKKPDTHGNWVPVPRWEPQVSVWQWPFISCQPENLDVLKSFIYFNAPLLCIICLM